MMIRNIWLCSLLMLLSIGAFAQENAVKNAFTGYKQAILTDKGAEALSYVDSRTIQYYEELLHKALHADSINVRNADLLDKMMILMLRHRIEPQELKAMDGRRLLVYAIEKGMVGKSSVANLNIGDITVEGDFAKGQLVTNGRAIPYYFHFYKEEGEWKLNLTSLFPMSTMALKQVIAQNGQTEEEFIMQILSFLSSRQPASDIWHPLVP